MEQVVEGEDEGGTEKDEKGDAPAGLAVDFGEEIGARDVKGDAAGQRESVLKLAGEEAGQEDARERSQAEASGGLEGAAAALAAGENNGGHGKTFGELVEKHGEEEEHTERDGNEESSGDGYAVEKGVDKEAEKNAGRGAVKVHGFGMDFFAEMEMRGQSVLEQMHEEEAGKDEEKCGVAAEADGFGDDVNKGNGEHVAGAESDEVLQELARPFAADNEIAAEEIAGRGNEAEGGGRSDAD